MGTNVRLWRRIDHHVHLPSPAARGETRVSRSDSNSQIFVDGERFFGHQPLERAFRLATALDFFSGFESAFVLEAQCTTIAPRYGGPGRTFLLRAALE